MVLSTLQLASIDTDLTSGNVIAAIREYRAFTGADLATAKQFVDKRYAELRVTMSTEFPSPIVPILPDPAIMATIALVADRDLAALRRVLDQIEKVLYGLNYQVTLSAKAVALSNHSLPIVETMTLLYPDSKPSIAEMMAITVEELQSDVIDCLTYEGDSSSGPQFCDLNRLRLNDLLIPAMWREISAITPIEKCTILSYNDDTGLPGFYVFWFFACLLHCSANGRCLLITGMSSD
jgi:hypothetical protein